MLIKSVFVPISRGVFETGEDAWTRFIHARRTVAAARWLVLW